MENVDAFRAAIEQTEQDIHRWRWCLDHPIQASGIFETSRLNNDDIAAVQANIRARVDHARKRS